jgi:chromosome segregation ATPase
MQIVKTLLGTNTDTVTDLVSLRARHAEAAGRVAAGAAELERLTATVQKLKLDRARLLDQRDLDPGLDLFEPIRRAEGALASAVRRLDDLHDVVKVRQENAETLAAEVRSAEQAAAPARMKALAREHAQDRAALRAAMTDLRSLAARILTGESDMQQLHRQHGVQATGVLIVEALATTARDTANELLGRLDWQDRQQQLGNELAGKLAADRAEVDRRNGELGYPLYVSPGVDYFTDGWVDETVEQRSQRVSG